MSHIEKCRNLWYATLKVPEALRDKLGRTKFKQSLGTADKRRAQQLAAPVVAMWKANLRQAAGEPDAANMETLLTSLEGLRAASFVDSVQAGLEKPALTVYAKFDDGKKEERVSFAKIGSDVYAAVPGQPGTVTLASTALDDLYKALDPVAK